MQGGRETGPYARMDLHGQTQTGAYHPEPAHVLLYTRTMRRQGPLTTRHLTVAVLVVILINAQLTWWIVYFLRENRTRLRLERSELQASCRICSAEIRDRIRRAENDLRTAARLDTTLIGSAPGSPFESVVRTVEPATTCTEGWRETEQGPVLRAHIGDRCVEGLVSWAWLKRPADDDPRLRLAQPVQGLPAFELPPPLDTVRIRPSVEHWDHLLRDYRGRIAMVVSEGTFFALLLLLLFWLLWRTFRRDVELERQHRNFLSAITHELKSPLASMRLALETVLRGRADQTASVRFLENALQDTERLQSLVQKVLEVTRFGGRGADLNIRRTNLSELVQEAVSTFSRRADSAGADLTADIEPDVEAPVSEEAFPIVVSNLLENAVKYGGTVPRVALQLRLEGESAHLQVTDNGNGIPDDDLELIFARFFRGGDEMTRTTHGTGLGLHLVDQIIRGHGGTVSVASTGPRGTTFLIVLPGAAKLEREVS